MKLSSIIIALVLFASTNSFAKGGSGGGGWMLMPYLSYASSNTTEKQNGVTTINGTTNTTTFLGANIGYVMSSGLTFFGNFDNESFTNNNVSISNYTRTTYGAGVGFIKNGFHILASYGISSTLTINTATATKWTGTGLNVDLGYIFEFGSWGLGPELAYRTFNYTTLTQSVAVSNSAEQKLTSCQ